MKRSVWEPPSVPRLAEASPLLPHQTWRTSGTISLVLTQKDPDSPFVSVSVKPKLTDIRSADRTLFSMNRTVQKPDRSLLSAPLTAVLPV